MQLVQRRGIDGGPQHAPHELARGLPRPPGRAGGRDRTLLPRLVRVADDRLLRRHGVDRASSPERARELLGPTVWTVLHDPGAPLPPPGVVADVVTRIEEL